MSIVFKVLSNLSIIFMMINNIYSQPDTSLNRGLSYWQGKESNNIVDYILPLNRIPENKIHKYDWNIVIRTTINCFHPIDYQVSVQKTSTRYNQKTNQIDSSKVDLIFEYPFEESFRIQENQLKKKYPNKSIIDLAKLVKVKRDTVKITKEYKYYDLIQKIDSIKLPLIWPDIVYLDGTDCEIYVQSPTIELYATFAFGKQTELSTWIVNLFKNLIEYYGAIDPYKDNK